MKPLWFTAGAGQHAAIISLAAFIVATAAQPPITNLTCHTAITGEVVGLTYQSGQDIVKVCNTSGAMSVKLTSSQPIIIMSAFGQRRTTNLAGLAITTAGGQTQMCGTGALPLRAKPTSLQ